MLRFTLLLVLGIGANAAIAGSYLEPEDSGLTGYESSVKTVLKEAYEPNVRARAIAEPSFLPEFAVGVKESAGKYSVFFLEPSAQVWQYTTLEMMKKGEIVRTKPDGTPGTAEAIARLEGSLPPKPTDLRVQRCILPIDPKLGADIVGAWKEVLSRVKPQPPTGGLDGETIHFSMTADGHELEAQTWSPPQDSEAGRMSSIVYAIRSACKSGHKQQLNKIYGVLEKLRQQ
jgi:hypothetical protein